MNARSWLLRSGLPVLALSLLLAGCGNRHPDSFQGYIEGEFVHVSSPLSGTLTNLAVARGDEVRSGQLLFELEREAELAALNEARMNLVRGRAELENLTKGRRPSEIAALEAQLERARASLALSETELARREQLHAIGSGVIATEELDQARAGRDANRALVDQLTAELETARLGAREDEIQAAEARAGMYQAALDRAQWAFDQKRQSSPAGARVDDTLYRSGEWVAAGRPVVTLLPPENIKVRFFVPEPELSRIQPGLAVSVSVDGAPEPFSATVNYISTEAEFTPPVIYSRENRAKLVFMIEAAFAPEDARKLRPGQPVDVRLTGE